MAAKLRKGWYTNAKIINDENGAMTLDLPEISEEELTAGLPFVSVVTITKDRGLFAGIMLHNWTHIKYPREKIEWIIVDDSDKPDYNLREFIPEDEPNVHYYHLDQWLPVAEKRNYAVSLAKGEIIVHMDDDDYYFPDHVLAKVRLMKHYNKEGVHSMPIGVYDMMEESSYIFDPGMSTNDIAEATLAYTKDYWSRHPFKSNNEKGMAEGRAFIGKQFHRWVNVHFLFNMISITHTGNITGHNRRFINERKEQVSTGDFRDVFPGSFSLALQNVKRVLQASYVQPNIPAFDDRVKK